MRTLLAALVLAIASCMPQGQYGRPISYDNCVAVEVDNRSFLDVTVRTERYRIGFASGLAETSLQTCRLTFETTYLVVDPVGATAYRVPLLVSPMGQSMIRLVIGPTNNQSYTEVW